MEDFFFFSMEFQSVFAPSFLKFGRIEKFAIYQDLDFKVNEAIFCFIKNYFSWQLPLPWLSFSLSFLLSLVQDVSFKEYLLSNLEEFGNKNNQCSYLLKLKNEIGYKNK